jgi:hypothetical protein
LIDSSSHCDVHDLYAAADSKHGKLVFIAIMEYCKVIFIPFGYNPPTIRHGTRTIPERIDVMPPADKDSVDFFEKGNNILFFPAIGDDGGNPTRFFNGVDIVRC